ncbi:uncharacterized GPI-anchored protein At1g61900 [Impatiens glandulifera]|uniref:uncharacterized GPI-anchored protein At1g61900 n=1 Tax=Impatiens glandulifera TaxID=253017 RepID=UPI001FB1712C|nr:uncharacterized GPI-anchored protein At1g61900 [Impatiens glandulifera]
MRPRAEPQRLGLFLLLLLLTFFLALQETGCSSLEYLRVSLVMEKEEDGSLFGNNSPSPAPQPQPLLPFLGPSPLTPLTPFTNSTIPKLSGFCTLNFVALESMMSESAIDCISAFAPYLANVVCCPQLQSTLAILIGQSSKDTSMLALNGTQAKYCLSDFEQILVGQGANNTVGQICSVRPSNLTQGSCPISDVNEFESVVETSTLLSSCENVDPVNECCSETCENAILEAARKLALKSYGPTPSMESSHSFVDHSTRISDCKHIVHRWLASKLDPSQAKEVLRGLSNCKINKACPLIFPDMKHITKGCRDGIKNKTSCCRAMKSYVDHLQSQSFVTNLQALNCATSLGNKLQKANITENLYNLCHISLKDFSLQVGPLATGCLLSSLPSDVTFDRITGVSFLCDLNDNIPAPWPSSQLAASSCNKTVKIPALPAAANGVNGVYDEKMVFFNLVIAAGIVLLIVFR